ncbi:MAG TPA: hypothetical protein VKN18_27825 [Blastocatellia bacterium]|nr:hypothetical protein [Blastocatellia bacterium]
MGQKDDCKDKQQTAELADLAPTTADTEKTIAGSPTFNAYVNTYLGGTRVAAGDV